jgi:hypothetical protein
MIDKKDKDPRTKSVVPSSKDQERKKTVKKPVKEIFEIEDSKGNVQEIEKKGKVEIPVSEKGQIKEENKQLRNVLIGVGIFILLILLIVAIPKSMANFEYKNTKFKMVNEENLIFYNTVFKIYDIQGAHTADYNFYIRNDPRKLEKEIPFEGELNIGSNMVLNSEEEFSCDGDGVIAIANLVKLYQVIGTDVIKDENATCDSQDQYIYVEIKEGNETKVEQLSKSCYDIYINDCEILKGTERYMTETFVKMNAVL